MKRIVKQTLIVTAIVVVLGGLFLGFQWVLRVKPTCFDGARNGEEEGVDCGGVCGVSCPAPQPAPKALTVKEIQVIQGGSKCDVVIDVNNSNNTLGAQHVPYEIKWGAVQNRGEFYIYPNEERYVAEMNLSCQSGQPQVEVKDPSKWELFRGFEKPNLEISNSRFNYPENSYEFAEVSGIVTNHSPFDLKAVEIYAIVKDPSGNVTAINRTTVNSLLVGEKREFRIFWTHPIAKNGVGSFFTTSNLFNSENFLKAYGSESAKWSTGNENANLNYDSNENSNYFVQ